LKPRTKTVFVVGAASIVAFVAGGFVGARLTSRQDEAIQAVQLSHAALKTTECVVLLRAMRDSNYEGATERLETQLDFAIINLAQDYTPNRDVYGGAEKSLDQAREYRASHPHATTLPSVDQQVQAALAMKTQSPAAK
jgi:hypothetical protein